MSDSSATVKGEARELLLNTAEVLFARHGVEGVSLRTINASAGVSPGVLHYHFGSREVLVHELVIRGQTRLWEARSSLLQPLLQLDSPSVHAIVHSLVAPLAALALQPPSTQGDPEVIPAGVRYVRFMARLHADRSEILDEVSRRYQEVQQLYPQLLARALPDSSVTELDLRFAMANHAMLQMLSDITYQENPWLQNALSIVDSNALTTMLVDFMASGISGTLGGTNEEKQA